MAHEEGIDQWAAGCNRAPYNDEGLVKVYLMDVIIGFWLAWICFLAWHSKRVQQLFDGSTT